MISLDISQFMESFGGKMVKIATDSLGNFVLTTRANYALCPAVILAQIETFFTGCLLHQMHGLIW